jgi:hypothetical protein
MKNTVLATLSIYLLFWGCAPKTTVRTHVPKTVSKVEPQVQKDTVQHFTSTPNHVEQTIPTNPKKYYWRAFKEIKAMLDQNKLDFKKAVFITENAWFEDSMSYRIFDEEIQRLATMCKKLSKTKHIVYDFPDYENVNLNASIFKAITDTTVLLNDGVHISLPYRYDFEDFTGSKNWSSMFVSKLLATHKGNCHSMPFLYKILALELNAKAWLAFAPHHIYIKSKCKKTGMYNTELTSNEFPTDAWIACSGYISTESIQSGIYMDTLSLKQSIAYTLYDLAKSYQRKFGDEDGEFILNALNELLKNYPNTINALLLKASVLTRLVQTNKLSESVPQYQEMEQTYVLINKLGYNEMPEQNYQEWLKKLQTAKADNNEINSIFKPKSK